MFRKTETAAPDAALRGDAGLPRRPGQKPGYLAETPAGWPAGFYGQADEEEGNAMAPEAKTLVIGKEINMKGEIGDCDRLLVIGNAEAKLTNCRNVEVTETGVLKGDGEVQQAEIRGRFEGRLRVRGRLVIRAGGRAQGNIAYAEIEVEPGGRIDGEIETIEPELVASAAE